MQKKRGAKIYGELCGYAQTNDALHLTDPNPEAKYATLAIKLAIERAKINPEQIVYINSHGTSTPKNDPTECLAIKQAFEASYMLPYVNSTKSMIGHTLSASGTLESIVGLKSMQEGRMHVTKNLLNPDIEAGCNLNYILPGDVVEKNIDYFLKNSFGFGGRNVSLVFGKV